MAQEANLTCYNMMMDSPTRTTVPTVSMATTKHTPLPSIDPLEDDDPLAHDIITSDRKSSNDNRQRIVILCLLGLVISLIIWDHCTSKHIDHLSLRLVNWIEFHPVIGVFIIIAVYIIATILFIPGSILTIGTAYAFRSAMGSVTKGVVFASTAVFFGASIGSMCSFLLGRYLLSDCVSNLSLRYPMLQAIDRALEGNGFKIMFLLRLSPLIPYNALDYLSGVTSISFWEYSAALIGLLPGTIMFCFIGATASSILSPEETDDDDNSKLLKTLTLLFGVVFAILGVTVASYYSKLELDKILQDRDEEQQENDQGWYESNGNDHEDDNNMDMTATTPSQTTPSPLHHHEPNTIV